MSLRYTRINVGFLSIVCLASLQSAVSAVRAQQKRQAEGAARAVVIDERLAALRAAPDLAAPLLQRMSRGRSVLIKGARRSADNVTFYRVMVTRRTQGWLQAEAVASLVRNGDDQRVLQLIRSSEGFDRTVRARIFLDLFSRSPLRPAVLLLYGEAAEEAAARLSRDAARRLDEREMAAGGAPVFSYFMNYNGLDRYRRQGVTFTFDRGAKRFHYDGESWREIVRRYPRSPEAVEARKRLESLAATAKR
ncbi:MAG TPA: hypothetical protein VF723_11915 [Pyrinomonadaceae bacterium]|jgi:hypothetical protein